MSKNCDAETEQYKDARKKFDEYLEQYIVAKPIQEIRDYNPPTNEVMDELDRLENDMHEKYVAWIDCMR